MVITLHLCISCDLRTVNFAVHIINILVSITGVESVYSAVRAESLYNTDAFRSKRVNSVCKYDSCIEMNSRERYIDTQ